MITLKYLLPVADGEMPPAETIQKSYDTFNGSALYPRRRGSRYNDSPPGAVGILPAGAGSSRARSASGEFPERRARPLLGP